MYVRIFSSSALMCWGTCPFNTNFCVCLSFTFSHLWGRCRLWWSVPMHSGPERQIWWERFDQLHCPPLPQSPLLSVTIAELAEAMSNLFSSHLYMVSPLDGSRVLWRLSSPAPHSQAYITVHCSPRGPDGSFYTYLSIIEGLCCKVETVGCYSAALFIVLSLLDCQILFKCKILPWKSDSPVIFLAKSIQYQCVGQCL